MLILVKHRSLLSLYWPAFEYHFKSSHFNPEEKVSTKIEVNRDLEVL